MEWLKYKLQTENQTKTISFVSHEFRTPLNCIVGMLQNLEQSIEPFLVNSCVHPALTSSKFLLNLVNDFLDIAQLQANTFKLVYVEFDLHRLLEDTIQVISIQAENRGLQLNLKKNHNINLIKSDPNRIRQIITNLLGSKIFINN